MSAIDDLLALIPPPAHPAKTGNDDDWKNVCEQIGAQLPDDLRILGMHYGNGKFNQSDLRIHNPFDSEYPAAIDEMCQDLRDSMGPGNLLIDEAYGVFPNHGGLYPLGFNGAGYFLNWLTKGQPDQWPILILVPGYEDETEQWDMPLIEFLLALFTNKIKTRMYSEPLTAANWNFRPREA